MIPRIFKPRLVRGLFFDLAKIVPDNFRETLHRAHHVAWLSPDFTWRFWLTPFV
jgi:hypothetical protein